MPKLKPGTVIPTPEEDTVIQKGIDADPDTMEFGADEAKRAEPHDAGHFFPLSSLYARLLRRQP